VLSAIHQATRTYGATSISHDNEGVQKHVPTTSSACLGISKHSRICGNQFGELPGKATLVTAHSSPSSTEPIATRFSVRASE
jgi:hypothetical protein